MARKSKLTKRVNKFILVMYIFSILGLISFISEAFLDINVNPILNRLGFIAIGVGLFFISGVFNFKSYFVDKKLSPLEIQSLVTGLISFIIIVVFFFDLFNINFISESVKLTFQGIAAIILALTLTVQTFKTIK